MLQSKQQAALSTIYVKNWFQFTVASELSDVELLTWEEVKASIPTLSCYSASRRARVSTSSFLFAYTFLIWFKPLHLVRACISQSQTQINQYCLVLSAIRGNRSLQNCLLNTLIPHFAYFRFLGISQSSCNSTAANVLEWMKKYFSPTLRALKNLPVTTLLRTSNTLSVSIALSSGVRADIRGDTKPDADAILLWCQCRAFNAGIKYLSSKLKYKNTRGLFRRWPSIIKCTLYVLCCYRRNLSSWAFQPWKIQICYLE